MSNRSPPVPPAGRSKKGPAQRQPAPRDEAQHGRAPVENTKEQAEQGNIHQNTTNQGYQQDR